VPRYRRIRSAELPLETVELAKALLGVVLVRDCPQGRTAGRVVETEAYVLGDPASHAYRGPSKRNASMFLPPFHAYVYKIYGTSFCVNVTSEGVGQGAAVLLRALEPLEGIGLMEQRRGTTRVRDLCRGPGRLCHAFDIDQALDGVPLLKKGCLWLAAIQPGARSIGSSTRIGITPARDRVLRFYERGNPFVSGPKALSP
jgi:DNA-3-methyladenine glycosylase